MSYLVFDKHELVNLEYSLSRETVRTNRRGSFASSTILGCNTRKYHGLLICPLADGQHHVFLSTLDASLVIEDSVFHLGIHKYPGGHYAPKGHMYVRDFETEPIPKLTYRIGDVVITREILLEQEEERILFRYTLVEASAPLSLRLSPYLAFRNIHYLSKANLDVNSETIPSTNGIRISMYDYYPHLYMQSSGESEFISAPDWYYNIEYPEEQKRGYDFQEDLFVPGYFEMNLKPGESIYFAAGLEEAIPENMSVQFDKELTRRIPRDSYENCLINSAQQFLIRQGEQTDLIAGYPWFGQWARDTFIALPGLSLSIGDVDACRSVLDTMASRMQGPLFANLDTRTNEGINAADAPLWYFWAVQQYAQHIQNPQEVWRSFGPSMGQILQGYKIGTEYQIGMHENGLIHAGHHRGIALTWMDSRINGNPITPRTGYPIEINALWYNALCFYLELAKEVQESQAIQEWERVPERVKESMIQAFWDEDKGYLADYVHQNYKDWSVRPNQVMAVSLPYSPLEEYMMISIMEIVDQELLTPKGLRTLSPKHKDYKGFYEGAPEERDKAYHQGSVWPWLLGHYCEAYLKLHRHSGLYKVSQIFHNFEDDMRVHGIGSISEVYDGNPPHQPRGAISQAWSVGELLRIRKLLDHYNTEHNHS